MKMRVAKKGDADSSISKHSKNFPKPVMLQKQHSIWEFVGKVY